MLPGYESQRSEECQWAFSTKRQSDYDTPILDADMTLTHSVRDASVAQITKGIWSDKAQYGKGHEFATQIDQISQDLTFARSFDGSSMILGWILAFALGKVTTFSNGAGSGYRHQMSFFDPDVENTACLPVTSVIEKVTGSIKRKLPSLAVKSLTLAAEGFNHIIGSADFIGSGNYAVSTLAIPALPTDLSYLSSNNAVIKLGNASEVISARVRSWNVAINNNPKEARGYFPGSGLFRGRMEIGSRSVAPSLIVDLQADSDILDDFLTGVKVALSIDCIGAQISGAYYHYLKMIFPDMYYKAVPIEEKDGVFTYNVSADEETMIYNSARDIPLLEVICQNTIPSYLTSSV